jgi:hypothetical protein
VSCYLENKSCAETAKHQGVAEATIWKRLHRARRLLGQRLTRRGISLTMVLGATAVGRNSAAGVPRLLLQSTAQAAAQVASGQALAGVSVSLKVLTLVRAVNKTMLLSKCKMVLLILLCVGSISSGVGWTALRGGAVENATQRGCFVAQAPVEAPSSQQPLAGSKPPGQAARPMAVAPQAGLPDREHRQRNIPKPKDSVTFSGRVLGPDGRPAGARGCIRRWNGAQLTLQCLPRSVQRPGLTGVSTSRLRRKKAV